MATCIRVERKNAEKERRKLAAGGMLDNSYAPLREGKHVYFAVTGQPEGMELFDMELRAREGHGKSLGEEMQGRLTKSEMGALVKSFDIVGDIAVLDIPPALEAKQGAIAAAILKNHRNVKVVAKKIAGTGGEFRIRPVQVIAGEHRTATVCREAGCEFELDLNEVYFSTRLETERTRICRLVKKGEQVLVPFAGVGPFAIRIAKKVPSAKVMGIDLNHRGLEYFWRNIERNGTRNAIAMKGDAASVLPGEFRGWADRLVMPHPTEAEKFLPHVIPCIKRGGMLHYYAFGDSRHPFEKAEHEVEKAAARLGRKAEIVFRRVVRPYSKSVVQVVLDARLA